MKLRRSRTKGELIPVVIFEFNTGAGDLWFTKEQYEDAGKYIGIIKSFGFSIKDILKVHHLLVNPQDFPTNDWEG